MMKRTLITSSVMVLVCAVMMVFGSCAESKLKVGISSVQKECPISLGGMGEVTSITYENDEVVFLYTLDDEYINIAQMAENTDVTKKSIVSSLVNSKTRALLEIMVDAGADLSMVIKGMHHGQEVKITLTPEELKETLDSPEPTVEERLRASIAQTKLSLPIDVGMGITITDLVDEGEYVTYMARVDDPETLSGLAPNVEAIKEDMKSSFTALGEVEKMFFNLVIEAGKGVAYCYYAEDSDEKVYVIFSGEELKETMGL